MATKRTGWDTEIVNEPGSPQVPVIDRDLVSPPGAPSNGDVYLIPTGGLGAWAGHDGELAGWDDVASTWKFIAPPDGTRLWIADEGMTIVASSGAFRSYQAKFYAFPACGMLSPNNADWSVNALAPLSADANNNALTCRLFDDTAETGIGVIVDVPDGAKQLGILTRARAMTAPVAARTVGLKLYSRRIPDNAAIAAWSAGITLTDIDIPTNDLWQYDEQVLALSSIGVVPGELTQFELTRIAPSAGVNLEGHWCLMYLGLRFS